jgi:hypothetical protein
MGQGKVLIFTTLPIYTATITSRLALLSSFLTTLFLHSIDT